MYPITEVVMALFEAEHRKVLRITGTDKNGASITITDDDVLADSFQIDRYSCNGEKLEVGTAIAAQMTFSLENGDGAYDGIVFEDTELLAEVGIADWTQENPTVHWVPCGYFTPDMQPRRLTTISITALDRMSRFDVVVDAADLTFPTTIAGLVGQVCTVCGVTLAQSIDTLTNADVTVAALPSANGGMTTYRNLIQWCAGVMGTNAWFDWNGLLRFSWYDNATNYVSTMDNRYSSDLYEDDLTVTGVEYTNDSGIAIVEGTDDYAIDLTGNAIAGPLIATVLPPLNTALNGFTYRPFTAAAINAPYLWPMDVVTFTDKSGSVHSGALTNVVFGLNGTTALESKGMTYAINKAAQPKGFTREQAQLVNQVVARDVASSIDNYLTQQEIFNRLTDNGAAQGLVLYDGQLYVNASYVNAGIIANANNDNNFWNLATGEFSASQGTLGEFTIDSHGLSKTGQDAVYEYGIDLNPNHIQYRRENVNSGVISQALLNYGYISLSQRYPEYQWANTNIYGVQDADTGASVLEMYARGQGRPSMDTSVRLTSKEHSDGGMLTVNAGLNVTGDVSLAAPLPLAQGGTGATSAADARTSLGITPANIGALPSTTVFVGGVKGNAESAYRSGNVNLTPANIGAVAKNGDTMTGGLIMAGRDISLGTSGSSSNDSGDLVWLYGNGNEKMRIWTPDTYTTKQGPNYRVFNASGAQLYSGSLPLADGTGASGNWGISVTGNAANVTGTVAVGHGGTGATTAANARGNLDIRSGHRLDTFSSGQVTLPFSALGFSKRPDVLILTPCSSDDCVMRYNWDASSSNIVIRAFVNGTAMNGNIRYSYIGIGS